MTHPEDFRRTRNSFIVIQRKPNLMFVMYVQKISPQERDSMSICRQSINQEKKINFNVVNATNGNKSIGFISFS